MTLTLLRVAAARDSDGLERARTVVQPRPVAEVLGLEGLDHARRAAALSRQRSSRNGLDTRLQVVDASKLTPDPRLVCLLGESWCLAQRALPVRHVGGTLVLLVEAGAALPALPQTALADGRLQVDTTRFIPCSADQLDHHLSSACPNALQDRAERRTALTKSCRDWQSTRARNLGLAAILVLLACLMTWPAGTFAAILCWGVFTLVITTVLKLISAVIFLCRPPAAKPARPLQMRNLPTVTVLVPLYKERDIASDLIRRLRRLDYPAPLLDICLVVEAPDTLTRQTVAATDLPANMRVIEVPPGSLQTKPRALNYALNFARGSIIGVYDAEDAPHPDQIRMVVNRFAMRDDKVACLQGRLDYYNSRTNWLARCFTIEYATWFRIVLPGLQRLGLAVPLGGTTLFFRRHILERLGGWDAHNVTEDADLGIRLARHGYRTEMIETVTEEEANARPWPWVKQRSRWLKGYALTYAVHMRNPRQLWRDLGPRAFLGVQWLFLGTLSQFVLMPFLWSLWLIAFGLPHPLSGIMTGSLALCLAALFIGAELIGVAISALAVRDAGKPDLMKWAPTLHVYFPLAAVAAYKGLLELATRPFYWDKTAHGIFRPTSGRTGLRYGRPQPRHPGAAGSQRLG